MLAIQHEGLLARIPCNTQLEFQVRREHYHGRTTMLHIIIIICFVPIFYYFVTDKKLCKAVQLK